MPGRGSYGSAGKWVHDRAHHIMSKNPDMDKGQAYAIATQQGHKLGKSNKGHRTPEGVAMAKQKYSRSAGMYKKTAAMAMADEFEKVAIVGNLLGHTVGSSINNAVESALGQGALGSSIGGALAAPAGILVSEAVKRELLRRKGEGGKVTSDSSWMPDKKDIAPALLGASVGAAVMGAAAPGTLLPVAGGVIGASVGKELVNPAGSKDLKSLLPSLSGGEFRYRKSWGDKKSREKTASAMVDELQKIAEEGKKRSAIGDFAAHVASGASGGALSGAGHMLLQNKFLRTANRGVDRAVDTLFSDIVAGKSPDAALSAANSAVHNLGRNAALKTALTNAAIVPASLLLSQGVAMGIDKLRGGEKTIKGVTPGAVAQRKGHLAPILIGSSLGSLAGGLTDALIHKRAPRALTSHALGGVGALGGLIYALKRDAQNRKGRRTRPAEKTAAMGEDLRIKGPAGIRRPSFPTEGSKAMAYSNFKKAKKVGSYGNVKPPTPII